MSKTVKRVKPVIEMPSPEMLAKAKITRVAPTKAAPTYGVEWPDDEGGLVLTRFKTEGERERYIPFIYSVVTK